MHSRKCILKANKGKVMIKEELINYLKKEYGKLLDNETIENDGEVAIYYFATDYHEGQNSDLYNILCDSEYKPNSFSTLNSEGETVEMLYMDLVQTFAW